MGLLSKSCVSSTDKKSSEDLFKESLIPTFTASEARQVFLKAEKENKDRRIAWVIYQIKRDASRGYSDVKVYETSDPCYKIKDGDVLMLENLGYVVTKKTEESVDPFGKKHIHNYYLIGWS
jgi:hypothetical protein